MRHSTGVAGVNNQLQHPGKTGNSNAVNCSKTSVSFCARAVAAVTLGINARMRKTPGAWGSGLAAGLLAMALAWLVGCRTAGYQRSDVASWNSQAAANQIQLEIQRLNETLGALNDLVNQPAADAKPQYLKFGAELDQLVASTRRSAREIGRMQARRAAYFALWEKEIPTIRDPAMRSLSESRKAEVSNHFDGVGQRCVEAQNALQPLIGYLQDIRKTLSTDLTRDGLAAIKPSVANANDRSRQVHSILLHSANELDTLSAKTASFRVQDVK